MGRSLIGTLACGDDWRLRGLDSENWKLMTHLEIDNKSMTYESASGRREKAA